MLALLGRLYFYTNKLSQAINQQTNFKYIFICTLVVTMFVKIYGAGELKQRNCHVVCAQMLNTIFWKGIVLLYLEVGAGRGRYDRAVWAKRGSFGVWGGAGVGRGLLRDLNGFASNQTQSRKPLGLTSAQVAWIGRWKGSWIHEAMNPKHNN